MIARKAVVFLVVWVIAVCKDSYVIYAAILTEWEIWSGLCESRYVMT